MQKNRMRNFRTIVHNILTFIFSLFGLNSCIHMAYGCPHTNFRIVGQVMDEGKQPIKEVKVYDCTLSNDYSKDKHSAIDITYDQYHFRKISDSTTTNLKGSYDVSVNFYGCEKEIFLLRFNHPEYEQKDTLVSFNRTNEGGEMKKIINVSLKKKTEKPTELP